MASPLKLAPPLPPLPLSSLCVIARGLMPMLADRKRGLDSMNVVLRKCMKISKMPLLLVLEIMFTLPEIFCQFSQTKSFFFFIVKVRQHPQHFVESGEIAVLHFVSVLTAYLSTTKRVINGDELSIHTEISD